MWGLGKPHIATIQEKQKNVKPPLANAGGNRDIL